MRAWILGLALLPAAAGAAWQWDAALDVSTAHGAAIFPHIESANRQGIAASGGAAAVAWEDNRSGAPRCYAAIKPAQAAAFQPEIALSDSECFEPVIVSHAPGRFAAAWESDGAVWVRTLPSGAPLRLGDREAAQVTLAASDGRLYAAWAEQAGRFKRVVVAALEAVGDAVTVKVARPVEAALPADEQAWPALAIAGNGDVVVTWEDRRHKHTVPYASRGNAALDFAAAARVSDQRSGRVDGLGAGLGAMRPTLASWGTNGTVAVWLDKRDFLSGYDVYAAFDGGASRFGQNVRVQDSFGDNMTQWHAKGTARGDRLVVVWDDARDGTPDVWLANWTGEAFGDNVAVPAAAGPGDQSDPVAALDEHGALHLAWLDRGEAGTRVRYARAAWR